MEKSRTILIILGVLLVFGFVLGVAGFLRGPQESQTDIPPEVAAAFQDELTERALARGPQPTHGFDAFMLLNIFPGLQEPDFDGVQSGAFNEEGIYSYADGELAWKRTRNLSITSAERTVLRKGYETLLKNLSQRLDMPASSAEEVLAIVDMVGRQTDNQVPGDSGIPTSGQADDLLQDSPIPQAKTPQEQPPKEQPDPRYTPPKTYAKTVRQTEPIILEGNEKFTIENIHWIQTANVVLRDNAELVIRNSFFDQQKKYGDQFNLEAYGNSRVVLENVELRNECTGGLGWNFFDNSSFNANKVQQKDCNIWVLATDSADTSITGWDWFGGTTCDQASTVVENSKDLEIELCNTQGVDIDVDLPVVIDEYEFSGRTVPGIKNSIILRNTTLDGWGPGAYYGTGVTVRNGQAVTISFVLPSEYTGKTVVLDGLGRKHYDDATWEFGEGYIRLVNTTMYGWETGVWGKDNTLIIRNSDFTGPTLNGGNSKVRVENSTFKAGQAFEFVEVEIKDSVITGEITARDNGKVIIRDSVLAGVQQGDNVYPVRITARDDGVVELFNTPLNGAILIEEGSGKISINE